MGPLLHPAHLPFDFALFAVMFVGAILLLIFPASRANRRAMDRPLAGEGVNRA